MHVNNLYIDLHVASDGLHPLLGVTNAHPSIKLATIGYECGATAVVESAIWE